MSSTPRECYSPKLRRVSTMRSGLTSRSAMAAALLTLGTVGCEPSSSALHGEQHTSVSRITSAAPTRAVQEQLAPASIGEVEEKTTALLPAIISFTNYSDFIVAVSRALHPGKEYVLRQESDIPPREIDTILHVVRQFYMGHRKLSTRELSSLGLYAIFIKVAEFVNPGDAAARLWRAGEIDLSVNIMRSARTNRNRPYTMDEALEACAFHLMHIDNRENEAALWDTPSFIRIVSQLSGHITAQEKEELYHSYDLRRRSLNYDIKQYVASMVPIQDCLMSHGDLRVCLDRNDLSGAWTRNSLNDDPEQFAREYLRSARERVRRYRYIADKNLMPIINAIDALTVSSSS